MVYEHGVGTKYKIKIMESEWCELSGKLNYFRLIISIFLVNLVGFALKIFELDTFLILFGFRFHVSLSLPLFLLFQVRSLDFFKQSFVLPKYRKWKRIVSILLIVNIIFISVLFLLHKIEIGDPEYFYEFGISSIVDYPIYLVWNTPQLILFYFFLLQISENLKNSTILFFAVIIFLFLFEFISLETIFIDYLTVISFLICALLISILFKNFNNVYLFIIFIFTLLWIILLAFGSTSHVLIKILFAASYYEWEGFFTSDNQITDFLIPTNLLLILISLSILVRYEKSKRSN